MSWPSNVHIYFLIKYKNNDLFTIICSKEFYFVFACCTGYCIVRLLVNISISKKEHVNIRILILFYFFK